MRGVHTTSFAGLPSSCTVSTPDGQHPAVVRGRGDAHRDGEIARAAAEIDVAHRVEASG